MRYVLVILLANIIFFSCDEKSNRYLNNNMKQAPYNILEEGDGLKVNYDSLSTDLIDYGKRSLSDMDFRFPPNEEYAQKILEIYGIDISQYANSIIALNNAKFPYIALKSENYILYEDSDVDNEYLINQADLFHYNNYIFYGNKGSYNLLKAKNPNLLNDLVIEFGYNKDKELTKYVLSNFDFSDGSGFHDLIFTYHPKTSKYELREYIFADIEHFLDKEKIKKEVYPNIKDIIEKILSTPDDYSNPQKITAFLFNIELKIGKTRHIEDYLNKNPHYKADLERFQFYHLLELKKYINDIDLDKSHKIIYFIQDPDGYTNLRKEKNISSEVIQKIKTGALIEVLDNSGDWFLVKTQEGYTGYVHKSRIKTSLNDRVSILLYPRPDLGSIPKQIEISSEDIEYLHKVSDWDFVRVPHMVGYLAPKNPKKHSFLVEEDFTPKEKKGFWDKLFG